MVTVIQRFGSGLQLNVHLPTLVLDGVFSETRPGQLAFHPAAPPSDEDVTHVLATVHARVARLLIRRQLEPEDNNAPADPLTEASPVLAGLAGASVQGRVSLGPRAGARVRRLGNEPDWGHATSRRGQVTAGGIVLAEVPHSLFGDGLTKVRNRGPGRLSSRRSIPRRSGRCWIWRKRR